jgi:curved DNA-binding protein CbpA
MNIEKDYYAILGILPSAEIVVIKAAYRALSKRYHPDVYKGPNISEKMADINEAYETLSNATRKSEYDEARGAKSQEADEYFNDDFGTHNTIDPMEADWQVAIKYHPDLEDAAARLTKYSKKLAYTYKAYMLETKDFENIYKIGKALADEFLQIHFGKNEKIILFAKDLFANGRTDILLELNKAIKVLGVSNANGSIIQKIKAEFSYMTQRESFAASVESMDSQGVSISDYHMEQLFEIWKKNPSNSQAFINGLRDSINATKKSNRTSLLIAAGLIAFAIISFMLASLNG